MKIYIEILDSEYIKIYELSTQIKSKIKTFKDSLNKDLLLLMMAKFNILYNFS